MKNRFFDESELEPTDRSLDDNILYPTKLNLGEYIIRLEPSTEISCGEKFLLQKIRKLSNSRGCIASNDQLGIYLGTPYRTIQNWIKNLRQKGYLIIEYPQGKARKIWCSSNLE